LRRTIQFVLFALIGIGTAAGLYGAWKRYQVEARNLRVELALDYSEVKTLAETSGHPLPAVLQRFKAAGVTSIAVTEDTLTTLEQQGSLHPGRVSGRDDVSVASERLAARIVGGLRARGLPVGAPPLSYAGPQTFFHVQGEGAPGGVLVQAGYVTLRPLGIGPDPEAVNQVRQAGLIPVGRISNFPAASPGTMAAVLNDLKKQGIRTVVFQGLEVLGFRGQNREAAEAILQSGIHYGQIEFSKQKGDERLAAALKGEYIRVHSIGDAEMGTLDENEAVDRFVRAARERNIRLCYIRLITFAGTDPVQTNAEYLGRIARGIARGREMTFGQAHLFGATGVLSWAFLLMAVGVAAGAALLLTRVFPLSAAVTFLALAGFMIVCAGAVLILGETGRKLVALLAALVFPSLACLRRDILGREDAGTEGHGEKALNPSAAARHAISGLIAASAVTSLGIIHVIGLLATRPFMLKADQFLGIKAAHAVPILLIGALAITGLPQLERPWAQERNRLKARASRFFSEPTRVGQLLLALLALAALALIVARTGNEPGVGVSGLELKFRSLLDKALPVRPRTKEFLVGHPAFVLALALWFRGRRRWALPLFVVGVVGQVSILNTFCHIHTPLRLSFIRDVTGLALGAVIGLAAFWVIEKLSPTGSRNSAGNQSSATADN
jgi:hypothetical protein